MKKIICLVSIPLFLMNISMAQIINVPGDQPNIQAGIDVANDGDTVLVDHGTYYENIDFLGKAITVASRYIIDQGFSHIVLTIIDGSQPTNYNKNSLVYFISGEDTTSVLCGFTIKNGTGTNSLWGDRAGGGIFCEFSSAKIIHNRIINNHVIYYSPSPATIGGGIYAGDTCINGIIILRDNTIMDNSVSNPGVAVGGGGFIGIRSIIQNNFIKNNVADANQYAWGGGLNLVEGALVSHNSIENNTVSASYCFGAGIIGGSGDTCKIIQNSIIGNICEGSNHQGGGVYLYGDEFESNIFFDRNIVKKNKANLGGGLYLSGSFYNPISNNIFQNNEAYVSGGGLFIECWAKDEFLQYGRRYGSKSKKEQLHTLGIKCQLINNTIIDNISWLGNGGGIRNAMENNDLLVMNNIFYNNLDAIYTVYPSSNVYVYHNNIDTSQIIGNWSGSGNIVGDPCFIDDSCHIPSWSCCLNTGIVSREVFGITYEAPHMDLEGDLRPDSICQLVDIGVDENDNCMGVGLPAYANVPIQTIYIHAHPNPCKSFVHLSFNIHASSFTTIDIFTISGLLIRRILEEVKVPGEYDIKTDISDLSPGLYIVRLQSGNSIAYQKLVFSP